MPTIRSVCIVDDAKGMRRLGEKFLQDAGIEVFTAADGYEAMHVIRENNPDACFVDREMPTIDGLKLISFLRGWSHWDDKPIAILSSAGSVFDREVGLLLGADLYLTKPFTKETIIKAIAEMDDLIE